MEKDVIIVGAGPAGLSAAIYARLDGWSTLILESDWVGGQGTIAYTVVNYPGFLPGNGKFLMETMEKQVTSLPPQGLGAEIKFEKVTDIDPNKMMVNTEKESYQGKAVIIATGSKIQKLGLENEEKFLGRGISYYAVRDIDRFKGKRVLVVGGGNSTAKSALLAKTQAKEVILTHRKHSMRAYTSMVKRLEKEGIQFRYNTEVDKIMGNDKVERVVLKNVETGRKEEIGIDWIVVCVGNEADTSLAVKMGLEMEGKFIKVDGLMRTSKRGVFACGEVVPSPRHLINAAATGATAGMAASEYLAAEMVKRGEIFAGAKNGKYAEEFREMTT